MAEMSTFQEFLKYHEPQLMSSAVPEHLWRTLHRKLTNFTLDAGNTFSIMRIDYTDLEVEETSPIFAASITKSGGITSSDCEEVYLVDHAWTFVASKARPQLRANSSLRERMCAITGVDTEDPESVDKIFHRIWRHCQSYSIQAEGGSYESRMPIWYVMDELGSAVNHSDSPNFRMIPFFHIPVGITYSLMFPVRNCKEGELVSRDFVENSVKMTKHRTALLIPWKYTDFREECFAQTEPTHRYFTSGHIPEILPEESVAEPEINHDEPLKVYSQYEVLTAHLTAPHFEIVDNEKDADVKWLMTHFRNFEELARETPNKFVNQFPYEYVMTIKDLLSIICRRRADKHHDEATLETYPAWLPTTYNLRTELVEFVSYYQHREDKNLDNIWIVKPFNLARGLDIYITNNLSYILRLPFTGPKVAQKYIENPVLFHRDELGGKVKFDVRYVIALKSAHPLEAYIHTKFYLRFANKPFSLEDFEDYEKHFTVMNYTNEAELKHLKCEDFVVAWAEQYPDFDWETVENEICKMLKELLLSATQKKAPCGIGSSPQSRAIYAADIMLAWADDNKRMQPKLLEVNWMPDCKRACSYYPEFFNDIFKLLFLDEVDDQNFRLITGIN